MNRVSKPSAADAVETLLETGRTQRVLQYDVELGLERHHHWLRSGAPVPEWASASVGAAAKSLLPVAIKTLLSIVLVGALAVGVWLARDRPQPSASAAAVRRSSPGPERMQPAAPSARAEPSSDAWMATTPIPVPDHGPPSEQALVGHGRKHLTPSTRPHKEPPAVPAASAAAVPLAERQPADTTPAHVEPAAVERTTNKARPAPTPQAQQPDDLAEMQEVATAEHLLERSPGRALALVRQGDQRFASGYFRQERAYIAIMALIQLGQIDEARARAASFAKQFPALPYGVRIRRALEAQKTP